MNRLKLIPLLVTFALLGCKQQNSSTALTLRTYDVPAGEGEQLRGLLNQAFVWNDKAQAKATVTPDGRLAVVGPEHLQEGVAALIKQLRHSPAASPTTVQLEYWMVLGKRRDPGAAGEPPSDALKAIAPALSAIEGEDGPQDLTLLEKIEARSLTDENAEAGGVLFDVDQNASVLGGKVVADVNIRLHGNVAPAGPNHLRTRLELPPGSLLVLGQTGFEPLRDAPIGEQHRTLYYVVRATLQNAPQTR